MVGQGKVDGEYVWINGEIKPFADASLHLMSHSLHYGSAAFEGIRAYQTKRGQPAVFRLIEHLERLERSVRVYGTEMPFDLGTMTKACTDVVRKNGFDSCYLRPITWFGHELRGLKLPPGQKVNVAVVGWRWGRYLGEDAINKGIRVMISSLRRPDAASSLPWAKLSGNYLNSILARREASLRGLDEALLLDQTGYVAEGSGENIFIVERGQLLTPPPNSILPGITRDTIMTLARGLGVTVREEPLTRNRVYAAEEAFFTGTAVEVTPIVEVDGYRVGSGSPGPLTRQLVELYGQAVSGALPEHSGWLTFA